MAVAATFFEVASSREQNFQTGLSRQLMQTAPSGWTNGEQK
ncbi:MAG: hypothetical protein K0R67_2893, partial [Paenibacillus sp.]|nr:hypothetical protein [Paenibacillus sp.]